MGSDRTKTWLQTKLADRDPQDWAADLVESIPEMADEAEHRALWVSTSGDNTNGDGSLLKPYKSIGTALANVAAGTLTVYVLPGTYSEAVTWPTTSDVHLIGLGPEKAVTVSGTSGTVVAIKPGATSGTFDAYLANLDVSHVGAWGIVANNSGMETPLNVHLRNVSATTTSGTSFMLDHTVAGTAVHVNWDGSGEEIQGPVYAELKQPGSRMRFRNVRLTGGLATDTTNVSGGTAEITLMQCEVLHAGVSGGTAAHRINAIGCWSKTGDTYAALDTDDLAGSHTENIIAFD